MTYYTVWIRFDDGGVMYLDYGKTQIWARKKAVEFLEKINKDARILIYTSVSTSGKKKLIGTVHIDRGLPEYIDSNLRPHPLNKDGSFKKKGVC